MIDRGGEKAPRRPDPLIGTVVAGRFRIEARLAAGGMGTVYRAEQLGLDRKVALKLLHAAALEGTEDSQSDDDFAVLEKRFSREAAILAKLSHQNIVTVFDYGQLEEEQGDPYDRKRPRFYMVMELLAGDTLQERLARKKHLPVDEMLPIARQIARGLREAHALGVVHRDLKPANVMIVRDRDGEEIVKLLDFGIGKILDRDVLSSEASDPGAELTQEGRFVGSPLYMSPEQIAHGRVDARTDIYTLGVVIYRCLAGIHPFHKDRTALVMLAHLHEQAIPLRQRVPEVPQWLGELVDRCLEKQPEKRPATMDEVYRSLADHSVGPASSGYTPIAALPPVEDSATVGSGTLSFATQPTPHTTTRPATYASPEVVTQDAPRRKRAWPMIAGAMAISGVLVLLIWLLGRRGDANTASPSASQTTEIKPSAAPSPAASSAAPAPSPSVLELAAEPSASAAALPKPKPTVGKPAKPAPSPSAVTPTVPDINLKR